MFPYCFSIHIVPLFAPLTIPPPPGLNRSRALLPATIPEQIQKINHPREIDSTAINSSISIAKYNQRMQ
jgi:hypothetical protein